MGVSMKNSSLFVMLMLGIAACADKPVRLVIDPPPGADKKSGQAHILYQTQDAATGKTETVTIPVSQMPQRLLIEENSSKADAAIPSATLADQRFADDAGAKMLSVSYLKGMEKVEALYHSQKYQDALIALAPLIQEYPKQAKLHVMQGTIYRRLGEKRHAYRAYKEALALDKNNLRVQQVVDKLEVEIGVLSE